MLQHKGLKATKSHKLFGAHKTHNHTSYIKDDSEQILVNKQLPVTYSMFSLIPCRSKSKFRAQNCPAGVKRAAGGAVSSASSTKVWTLCKKL